MWDCIKQGDFVSLSERWVEEKDRKKLENKLPRNFMWQVIPARREARKGRAKGGFLIGTKTDLANGDSISMQEIEEGHNRNGEEKLIIWSVYSTGNMERYCGHWQKINRDQDVRIIVGGDFNIRIEGDIFRRKTAQLEIEEREEDSVETRWYDTKRIIEEAVTKKNIKIKKRKLGQKKWCDRSCSKKRGRL